MITVVDTGKQQKSPKKNQNTQEKQKRGIVVVDPGRAAQQDTQQPQRTDTESQTPGVLGEAGRHVGRSAARVAEGAGGALGNITQPLRGLYDWLHNTGTQDQPDITQSDESQTPSQLLENFTPTAPNVIPELPTTQDVRENVTEPISEAATGTKETIRPQTSAEQFSDDVFEDVGSLVAPFAKTGKMPRSLLKSVGLPNIAKYAARSVGIGKGGQESVKLGSLLFGTIGTPRQLLNTASQNLSKGDAKKVREIADQGSKIRDFLSPFRDKFRSGIGLGLFYTPKGAIAAAGADAAATQAESIEKGLRALNQSPELRRATTRILKGAATENSTLVSKGISQFNTASDKIEND